MFRWSPASSYGKEELAEKVLNENDKSEGSPFTDHRPAEGIRYNIVSPNKKQKIDCYENKDFPTDESITNRIYSGKIKSVKVYRKSSPGRDGYVLGVLYKIEPDPGFSNIYEEISNANMVQMPGTVVEFNLVEEESKTRIYFLQK